MLEGTQDTWTEFVKNMLYKLVKTRSTRAAAAINGVRDIFHNVVVLRTNFVVNYLGIAKLNEPKTDQDMARKQTPNHNSLDFDDRLGFLVLVSFLVFEYKDANLIVLPSFIFSCSAVPGTTLQT